MYFARLAEQKVKSVLHFKNYYLNMKFFVKMSLGALALAAVLGIVSFFLYQSGKYAPKLVVFIPFLVCMGIAFLLFPGVEPGPEIPDNKKLAYSFSKSKILVKIMWILFALIGLALGLFFIIVAGSK